MPGVDVRGNARRGLSGGVLVQPSRSGSPASSASGGGSSTTSVTIYATTAITSAGLYAVDASAGNVVLALPDASTFLGEIVVMKVDSSANTVTLQPIGGQTWNGDVSKVLDAQWQVTRGMPVASNWGAGTPKLDDLAEISSTAGDTLYRGVTQWDSLPIGASGRFYRSTGSAPSWQTAAIDDLSDVAITAVATDDLLKYNGTNWVNVFPSQVAALIDHGLLIALSLLDDDHPQYALLAGRTTTTNDLLISTSGAAGGTLTGSSISGGILNLLDTSHATKGYVLIGAAPFATFNMTTLNLQLLGGSTAEALTIYNDRGQAAGANTYKAIARLRRTATGAGVDLGYYLRTAGDDYGGSVIGYDSNGNPDALFLGTPTNNFVFRIQDRTTGGLPSFYWNPAAPTTNSWTSFIVDALGISGGSLSDINSNGPILLRGNTSIGMFTNSGQGDIVLMGRGSTGFGVGFATYDGSVGRMRGGVSDTGYVTFGDDLMADKLYMRRSTRGLFEIYRRTAATNTILTSLSINAQSTGTAAAGYGTSIDWYAESSTTDSQQQASFSWEWVVATHASRTARGKISAYDTAARECVRFEASGSAAMIGFLGAAAIARPAAYTLTGSATRTMPTDPSGAYTGIDNAQPGTVYATVADLNTLRTAVSSLLGVVRQHLVDMGAGGAGFGLLQ